MSAKRFEDLEVWISAKNLAVLIYKLSEEGNFKKDFGLKDQLRRAAVSIVSNIAEGFERNGNKEFIQFLSIAKGSAGEIRAQLFIAKDLNYLNEKQFNELNIQVTAISKMLSGFINYLKQSELKGSKYN
jgi:four helix bundle protein